MSDDNNQKSRGPRKGAGKGGAGGGRDGGKFGGRDGGGRFGGRDGGRGDGPRGGFKRGGAGREEGERKPFRSRKPETEGVLLQSLRSTEPERIAKVMARAGVASRRDSEQMIAEGRVSVNGTVLESPALDIGPDDVVLVDGEPLPARERTRMWLYHKPRWLVTTNFDPEGRPTVFDNLPEDLPRVLSVGRLDINTEGLLLLTNDGGLARMLELPQTGWLRRYRVRAFGSVTQDRLDTLRDGVTIEGVAYGPVIARFEREQGSNTWLVVDLREGKNREVKTVLEHLGLAVNRLIRVSFGPFQLGDLAEGEAEEVRSRVLKDQLGEELMAQAGVDFESPRRDELPPAPPRAPAGEDRPRRRKSEEAGPRDDRGGKSWDRGVWRDEEAQPQRSRRAPPRRGADPKLERQAREATGEVRRERAKPVADPSGRRVLVERVSSKREEPREEAPVREGRLPRHLRGGAAERIQAGERAREERSERPARSARPIREDRPARGDRPPRRDGDDRPMRSPRSDRPARDDRAPRQEWAPRQDRGPRRQGASGEGASGEGRPPRRERSFDGSGDRPQRSERPFSPRGGDERGGAGERGKRPFSDKRSFGEKRSFDGDKRSFGDRPGGGGRSGSGGRPGGGSKFGGGKPGAPGRSGPPRGPKPGGSRPGGSRPGGSRPGGGPRGKRD